MLLDGWIHHVAADRLDDRHLHNLMVEMNKQMELR